MKTYFRNLGYFLRETITIIKLNWVSNIFTLLSTSLIFFMVLSIISSWWLSKQVIENIEGEAEISLYFDESIDDIGDEIVGQITGIEGVQGVKIVDKNQAYDRMVKVLGEEASVLEFLDDNPFSPFIEVQIHIGDLDTIVEKLKRIKGVDHIKDNKEILDYVINISNILSLVGYLFIIVGVLSTLVIVSHIIRLGIYNNKEQINTLKLLGAPRLFISFPYLLVGLVLTLGGGGLSLAISRLVMKGLYRRVITLIPFMGLAASKGLVPQMSPVVIIASGILGLISSSLALLSIKNE